MSGLNEESLDGEYVTVIDSKDCPYTGPNNACGSDGDISDNQTETVRTFEEHHGEHRRDSENEEVDIQEKKRKGQMSSHHCHKYRKQIEENGGYCGTEIEEKS